jgi:diadenosine tetraphosphate (Ap4A) HIT family hydrolase
VFAADPAFDAASEPLIALALCEVRLQRDGRFPWLILIPRLEGLVEIEDLAPADRARLMDEAVLAGRAVRAMGEALGRRVEKLNVGQLGNITRQLHLHVVGRRPDDAAWPGPVWGQGETRPYGDQELSDVRAAALASLEGMVHAPPPPPHGGPPPPFHG